MLKVSIYISYLVIPIVFLVLIVNVYFRFKIIKSYKKLKDKRVEFNTDMVFKHEKAKVFLKKHYPEHADEVIQFIGQLRKLLLFTALGLLTIVVIFLMNYFL